MSLEIDVYLYDIHVAIERINTIIGTKTFETYSSDETLVSAVERGLSLIGEAVSPFADTKDNLDQDSLYTYSCCLASNT